jgi:hypothetical protein
MKYARREQTPSEQYGRGSQGQDRRAPVQRLRKPKLEYDLIDLEIYECDETYRARLPYTIGGNGQLQNETLEVILNGSGRNKAVKKILRFLDQLERQLNMPQ